MTDDTTALGVLEGLLRDHAASAESCPFLARFVDDEGWLDMRAAAEAYARIVLV